MSNQDEKQQNALEIVNDPKNKISVNHNEVTSEAHADYNGLSRRNLLKYGGATAAALSIAGSAATGFTTGRSADGYTGYGRTGLGKDQFFNREPFRAEVPAMMDDKVGESRRPSGAELLFERRTLMYGLLSSGKWNPTMGAEKIPGPIGKFYQENPKSLDLMVQSFEHLIKTTEYWKTQSYDKYAIYTAYAITVKDATVKNNHMPENPRTYYAQTGIETPPEVWDYRGVAERKMEFKSPAHASQLIKEIAYRFGASVVATTPLYENAVFTDIMRGMKHDGHGVWGDKIPEHWKSVIVFATVPEWDMATAAADYSTAFDGYHKTRTLSGLIEGFIKKLGYPARAQFPPNDYEISLTPHTLMSGLGEYARAGYTMIPELGSNFKSGAVITDIEFEYDKPINIGMAKFCEKCKICADTCPSGSIDTTDKPEKVVRGYRRWKLEEDTCHLQWMSGTTPSSHCGICIGVCPFTRKNTWIHAISRELDARDKTGLFAKGLLAMQENFFKYPKPEEFKSIWDGGKEATYHNPPWWMKSEEFFENVKQSWIYEGMH